jgi:arylsulfatase
VAYTAPHWPLHALEEDIARYNGQYDAGWDAIREARIERMRQIGLLDDAWPLTPRDPRVPAWEAMTAEDRIWYSRAMEVYAAQVDRMDQGIGRLLDALEEAGNLDRTLIFFLADNGGCADVISANWSGLSFPSGTRDGRPVAIVNEHRQLLPGPEETFMSYGIGWANASNTPFRLYKHWVHEGGISTPLIVHWPAQIDGGGRFVREPGHIIDVMATAVDVAGALYPADKTALAGTSLAPTFHDEPLDRTMLFWEHEGNRAVRQGNWKLVARHDQPWELYDLEADRSETNDLTGQHREKVAELTRAYEEWAATHQVRPWPLQQ